MTGISNNNRFYFDGTTTKDALGYKVGEKIVFKLYPMADKKRIFVPYSSYICEGDDGKKSKGIISPNENGEFVFETQLRKAGFVHLCVKALDENKKEIKNFDIYEGGAGADLQTLKIGTEQPKDYFEFWQRLKDKFNHNETVVNYDNIFYSEEYSDFEFRDMSIKVTDDMNVQFILSYPKGAKDGTLDTVLIFRGYGVSKMSLTVNEGCLTAYVNAHDILNFADDEYYENIKNTILNNYGFDYNENKFPETSYWAKMFMRDIKAAEFVHNYPLGNRKKFNIRGGSQGAFQAANVSLHTDYATECFLAVPWFSDLFGCEVFGRLKGWRPKCADGLRYFDTAIAVKNLTCPVYMVAGLGDYTCPPSGQIAMFNSLNAPKRIDFIQNRTHQYRPPVYTYYSMGNLEKTDFYKKYLIQY